MQWQFRVRRQLKSLPAIIVSSALVAAELATPVSAQSWFSPWGSSWERGRSWERDRWPRRGYRDGTDRRRRPDDQRRDTGPKTPTGPITAIVSLEDQSIEVYGGDRLLARSRVSTGSRGYRTPTGVFSVIQKNRYHESNIYSGAPMPWMQRITWSGIALHGGVVPGYPASHGCIRLTYDFAPRLWDMTRLGARIIVSPREIEPAAISHPRLPAPAVVRAPPNEVSGNEGVKPIAVEVASGERPERRSDAQAGTATVATGTLPAPEQNVDTPLRRARAAKVQATADVRAAETAWKSASMEARKAAAAARQARAHLHKAQTKVTAAEKELAADSRATGRASDPEAAERLGKVEAASREGLEAAQKALADAAVAEAIEARAASDAAEAVNAADAARDRATGAVKALARATEPISVFVSRKEGRVLVRQGLAPLLDGGVTIRDPDRWLGTHVFTAISDEDGGARLRWSVVTVPDDGQRGSPAEALDRIELAAGLSQEISNRLWIGATLIVSDRGISEETSQGTDFVVLTRP